MPVRKLLPWIFALLCVVGLVYGSSLRNEFVTWDDPLLLADAKANPPLTLPALRHVFTSYDPELYTPLTRLSFQVDERISGGPFILHLSNLLLHAANVLLVFALCFAFTRKTVPAFLAALLFAVHPLLTETVVWASARKDLLATFFFLLTLLSYLRLQETHRPIHRAWVYVSFLLGLLSKVTVAMTPLALVLVDGKESRPIRASLKGILPMLPLSILFGVIALFGKSAVAKHYSFFDTILLAPRSLLLYLSEILWPAALTPMMPAPATGTLLSASTAFSISIVTFLLVSAWFLRKKMPEILFCLALFIVLLLPTFLNVEKGGAAFLGFDHYAYMPFIAVALLAAFLLARFSTVVLQMAAIAVCMILALLAHRQSLFWKDSVTLYTHAIAITPTFAVPYNNLGAVQLDLGQTDEAVGLLKKALALDPSYVRAHRNLGWAYGRQGKYEEALLELKRAMELDPRSTDGAEKLQELLRRVGTE